VHDKSPDDDDDDDDDADDDADDDDGVGADSVDGLSATQSTISGSSISLLPAIMIDWRAMTLERVLESWLSQACVSYVRMSLASSPPLWLLQNGGQFATYLITRIDVSENCLIRLPCMLFSLPSLRILIAARNQVSLFVIRKFNSTIL